MKLLQRAERSNTIIGNSFLIFLIRFFPSLATVLVVIFFSRNLEQSVYGQYQDFWVQLLLLSAVGMLGIPAFVLTYTPAFVSQLSNKLSGRHYAYLFLWMAGVATVFTLLQINDSRLSWFVPFSFFIIYSLNAILESVLIVFRKFSFLLWVNVFYTLVFLALHYGVIGGEFSINDLFMYLLAPGILKLLLVLGKANNCLKMSTEFVEHEYTISEVRSLWFHVGVYDILQKFFTWIDKFVISLLFSAGVFAMYFNGTFDIPFLPLLLGAVSSAALLQMSSFSKKGDVSATVLIANQTARILSAVVFPLFFFLFVFRYELFNVILTNKYEAAIPIFAATVCVVPLRAYNFTSILQNRHKGRIINIGAVMDIVIAILLMYPLYCLWGLLGIALSFVLSSYIQGAYYLYHTGKVLNTPIHKLIPITNWLVKLLLFGILFFVLHHLLVTSYNSSIVLLLGSITLVVVLLLALLVEFRTIRTVNGESVSQKKEQG